MLGYYVDVSTINQAAAQCALSMRNAFQAVDMMNGWLADHPVVSGTDPLVATFGYSVDEAYAIRLYFQSMGTLRSQNQSIFDIGRKFTGLQ